MRPVKVPKLWAKLRKEDKRGRQEKKEEDETKDREKQEKEDGGKTSVVDEATRRLFATPFLKAQIYKTLQKVLLMVK